MVFLKDKGNAYLTIWEKIAKFFPLLFIKSVFEKLLKSQAAMIDGCKMRLDHNDSLNLSINGTFEPFETHILKNLIKKGNNVLDLGANIGYYTLIFSKLVGKKGKVFAFEPDPYSFSLLERNVEANGFRNVILIQKAVSDSVGTTRLYLSDDNNGDHRIYDSNDNRKSIEIETIKLDDYFKNYKDKIDLIKMDIQGAEGRALQSMLPIFKKDSDVKIVTEFWPLGLKRCGMQPANYLKILSSYNFTLLNINEKNKRLERISINRLLQEYTIQKESYTNLLCLKNSGSSPIFRQVS